MSTYVASLHICGTESCFLTYILLNIHAAVAQCDFLVRGEINNISFGSHAGKTQTEGNYLYKTE